MTKYSVDVYNFKSRLTYNELFKKLNHTTLKKKYLTMESTDKDFIGRIQDNTFEIFQATFFAYGAVCVLQGIVTSTSEIKLTTTLHKAFRTLFNVWIVVMTALFLVTWMLNSPDPDALIIFVVGMPIGIIFFRLFLHVAYVVARNEALRKIKEVLEIT
jgi:hypothetical protein